MGGGDSGVAGKDPKRIGLEMLWWFGLVVSVSGGCGCIMGDG